MSSNLDSSSSCNSDEDMLSNLFTSCDDVRSGQVKTIRLIEGLSKLLDKNSENEVDIKTRINDLARRLDPRSDNGYVDRATFMTVGKSWIDFVRENENNNSSRLMVDTDFDLSENNLLNHTFGSLEALNRSVSNGKVPYVELAEENNDLKTQVKALTDDKTKISNLRSIAEDNNAVLQATNSDLKEELRLLRASMGSAKKNQTLADDLKNAALTNEEKCRTLEEALTSANSRLNDIVKENASLQRQVGEANSELVQLQDDLTRLKSSQAETLENMKVEKEETELKLNETLAVRLRLEQQIQELSDSLSNARESQQFQKTPPVFADENLDFSFDGESAIFAKVCDNDEEGTPVAVSTPALKLGGAGPKRFRGSIGDEIKYLGVHGSPLCEKSFDGKSIARCRNRPIANEEALAAEVPPSADKSPKMSLPGLALSGIVSFVVFIVFTFFGAIRIGNEILLPVTWPSTWGLPEPYVLLSLSENPPLRTW